jgi:subtilisin family serine protease
MKRLSVLWPALLALLVSFSNPANSATFGPALQGALKKAGPYDRLPIIVRFADALDLSGINPKTKTQKELLELLQLIYQINKKLFAAVLQNYNASEQRDLWIINAQSLLLPKYAIQQLRWLPFIEHVALDRKLALDAVAAVPPSVPGVPGWNLGMIHAPLLWTKGARGQGMVVAIVDSGVDASHPALADNWRGGNNSWFDAHGEHIAPYDASGHGTRVAGVAVGGESQGNALGVAPSAQWIAAKIFSDAGEAPVSAIHAAFQWLLDPDGNPASNDFPHIVNNSWSFSENVNQCVTEFDSDIATMKALGITVLFSAGNVGNGGTPNTSTSPGNTATNTAVAAVNSSGLVSGFSSRGVSACDGGLFPHISAPGDLLLSADTTFGHGFDSTATVSGTSFAAPHVAGALALLGSILPFDSSDDNLLLLQSTAQDIEQPGDDNAAGKGLLDLQAAYDQRCSGVDTDGDGIPDMCDNCSAVSNAGVGQLDADRDGYGNRCDGDLNNDGAVTITDFVIFRGLYGQGQGIADFNADGKTSITDLVIFRSLYGGTPGPSGFHP